MQSPTPGNGDLERRKGETKVGRAFWEKEVVYLTLHKSNVLVHKTSLDFDYCKFNQLLIQCIYICLTLSAP